MKSFLMTVLLCVLPVVCQAADYGKVTSQKVAEGVYLFTTTPYGDVGFCGNSIAVVSSDGVLVFDTGGIPDTASTILAEVRNVTDQPVRYVVNSHWHWDHWGGNQVFASAFPGVQIITHETTRKLMMEVEPRWNDEGLKVQLPGYVEMQEKNLAAARAAKKPESELEAMEELLKTDRNFLEQKTILKKTIPEVTFSDSMTLWMGEREIQIHHARAITAGDTYLYLPEQKILITGDTVLDPYPYSIGGTYPSDWLKTLREFQNLKPEIIIPGHGHPVNVAFLQKQTSLFEEVMKRVKAASDKGLTLEQTSGSITGSAAELAALVDITDKQATEEFKAYFLNVFVARAYKELQHPLGDSPIE